MATKPEQKLPLLILTGMVVGSIVCAGIISLPRTLGAATGAFGAIIAAGGMYMLTGVFQTLGEKRTDGDSGVLARLCPRLATTGESTGAR